MNTSDITGIRMTIKDYFRLPSHLRFAGERLMVLSIERGREVFVNVIFVG